MLWRAKGSVPAHRQKTTHSYTIAYPEHAPRRKDPHYRDFEEYRRRTRDGAECQFALDTGDSSECRGELELHHSHIEFALQNGVDLARMEHIYPGVSDSKRVGEWIESSANLTYLCVWHHRGHGGVHSATASDFEASRFVKGLIA